MKIAIHQITTKQGSFEEQLATYQKTGWKHFEIHFGKASEFIGEHGADGLAKRVADHGLTCVGATGHGMRAFQGDAERAEDIETIRRFGESMQALNCAPLVIGSDAPGDLNRDNYSTHLNTLADHIRNVADAGAEFGVKLAVEVNWVSLCRSFSTAAKLVRQIDHDNVGLVWDPAHFVSTPSRLSDLTDAKGLFIHAHLNDIHTEFVETISINGDRVIPGEGDAPLTEWTDVVTAAGYGGFHAVELFNKDLWSEDTETVCMKVMDGCRAVWPDATF